MRNSLFFAILLAVSVLLPGPAQPKPGDSLAVAPPFTASVLAEGFEAPWEMLWGPDGHLWLTERQGARITRVDPRTGTKTVVATIQGVHTGPQHEGLLGMAFAPGATADRAVLYVTYTHKNDKGEWQRVSRYAYDGQGLSGETVILDGIPAGDDHQGGRLLFARDGTLLLTKGELGHNQGANYCIHIEAQRLPTKEEIEAGNYAAYVGKILRMTVDGFIPQDNPALNGVVSHVYTLGHRNPQGLAYAGNVLFASEHGPSSDDEINIIVSGGNYGWPHVAGYPDDNSYVYARYADAPNCADLTFDANVIPDGVPRQKESEWPLPDNFRAPAKTFHTVPPGYDFTDPSCGGEAGYLCWPTIAPSGIAFYPEDGAIEGWRNSLLVTSMKTGTLYRLPLGAEQKQVQGTAETLFRSPNRYRVVRPDPEGRVIYIATDSAGNVIGMDGKPTATLANPGAILRFEYTPRE